MPTKPFEATENALPKITHRKNAINTISAIRPGIIM